MTQDETTPQEEAAQWPIYEAPPLWYIRPIPTTTEQDQ